jgi:hypothetical protein
MVKQVPNLVRFGSVNMDTEIPTQKYFKITLFFSQTTLFDDVSFCEIRGATQNFREFEYTAQTVDATNLRRKLHHAVSFNRQSANWRPYNCTCFRVLAVFFTLFQCVSAIIEMADVKEQRICIKFCFKLNKTAAETHRMLKEAFGEQTLSQARTFEWFKHFKDGRESVDDCKHSGQPSTCTTPEIIVKVH